MNKKSAVFIVAFLMVVIVVFIINSNNKKQLTEYEIEWLKSQDAIIYAANESAPPLRFVDKIDNQYKGVVVDIVNLLSLELGTDIQTVPMKWDDALLSLKEGHTHLCDMFINKERSQDYLFTDPIYNLRTVLLTKTDDNIAIEDINNIKISTELGDYANSYLKENYPGAELVYTHNVEEAFELFLEGEVDAVIGDEPIITFLLVERNDSLNLEYSNIILYEEEVVFAVAKDKQILVHILNKGINQLKYKGQLEKIQQKWFGISTPLTFEVNQSEVIRKIVITAIVIGSALILILLYNFQLQELVKKRTEELENSRNELQIIFDGISEFMLVVDKNKNVLKINKSLAEYFPIVKEYTIGKKCDLYIKKFCNDCSNCLIEEAFGNKKNIKKEVVAENEVYEMNFQHLKDINNTLLIRIKNITLDKINRNRILQTNKMIAVGQLAAGMAHEIRNPLGIVRTQSYLLRMNDKIEDAALKSLDFIDSAVGRASKIIDNILSFSRLSNNESKIIDINQMVSKLVEMHNDAIKKNNINVKIESNIIDEIKINGDSIEHIILNLLSNSVDAMESGGDLFITTHIDNNDLIIICQDTGSGIDDNSINNIFNPFFTTKELGKGTGLGLFIVYSEVEKLNGKIDVRSKINEGTIFTITIPLERKSS